MASIAARGSKARPKFVCKMVPVALTTRICPGWPSIKICAFDSFDDRIFTQVDCATAPPDLSAKLFQNSAAFVP